MKVLGHLLVRLDSRLVRAVAEVRVSVWRSALGRFRL